MSPEDKKIYDDYFDMFSTPGWVRFVEAVTELRDTLDHVLNVKDVEGLYETKGRLLELNNIINLKASMEYYYAAATENDDETV